MADHGVISLRCGVAVMLIAGRLRTALRTAGVWHKIRHRGPSLPVMSWYHGFKNVEINKIRHRGPSLPDVTE